MRRISLVKREIWILSIGLLLFAVGCERSNSSDGTALPLPPVDLSTPESATRTLLLTLKAQLDAGARRDAARVDAAVNRLASGIAAAEKIVSRLPQRDLPPAMRTAAVTRVAGAWARMVSHYAVEFDFDDMRRGRAGEDEVSVLVSARGAADATWLRIDCSKIGQEWRVSRIDFLRGQPASKPAAGTGP